MKGFTPYLGTGALGVGIASQARRVIRDYFDSEGIQPQQLFPQYSQRRRSGSKTVNMRRQRGETSVFSNDYTRKNRSSGRKAKKNLRQAWKRITSGTVTSVLNHRNYSQWGGVSGAVPLVNTSTTLTTGLLTPPCQLYDVTCSPNTVGTGATINIPNSRWDFTFSDPTSAGNLVWINNAGALNIENNPVSGNVQASYPGAQSVLDWVQVKMLFYAPTTRPTRIVVQLVQFNDERLVPGAVVSDFSTAFWQSMVKKFTYSPLESGDNRYAKYLKVMFSESFIMDPKDSTEAVNTRLRELNIFKRMNRVCHYNWTEDTKMAMGTNSGQANQGETGTVVHPRARIFLLIRGLSANATAVSTALMPSYDIILRTSHSMST